MTFKKKPAIQYIKLSRGMSIMDEEKKWMLITYYCPTHGDSGIVKPIELTKKEISKTFLKKNRSSKINFLK